MKTKLTKVIAMMFVVLMVVTALPVYAGSADSINCDETKASKILPKEDTKGHCWWPSYPEPPMGTELGTWMNYSSNYVKWLQECLNMLGYNCGTVDGWYGNNTRNAVRSFQQAKRLVADGIFGDNTHMAIMLSISDGPVQYYFKVTARSGLNVRSSMSTSSSNNIVTALSYGSVVLLEGYYKSSNGDIWTRYGNNYVCAYSASAGKWYITRYGI